MSNETSILPHADEEWMPAAIGFEAATKYRRSHSPADAETTEPILLDHPEQGIILALTFGLALGWILSEAAFPQSSAR
jgi:hypothetical protein